MTTWEYSHVDEMLDRAWLRYHPPPFRIDHMSAELLVLSGCGVAGPWPWPRAAEHLVALLEEQGLLGQRRVLCSGDEGPVELLVAEGRFAGFGTAGRAPTSVSLSEALRHLPNPESVLGQLDDDHNAIVRMAPPEGVRVPCPEGIPGCLVVHLAHPMDVGPARDRERRTIPWP